VWRQEAQTRGREFERQRNSFYAVTDRRNLVGVRGEIPTRVRFLSTLCEQLPCTRSQDLAGTGADGRKPERREVQVELVPHTQRRAAGDEQLDRRRPSEQLDCDCGDGLEQVLGVVDEQHQRTRASRANHRVEARVPACSEIPSDRANVSTTSSSSRTSASITTPTCTPSSDCASCNAASASVDLPIPPGPVTVIRRGSDRRSTSRSSVSSRNRPTSGDWADRERSRLESRGAGWHKRWVLLEDRLLKRTQLRPGLDAEALHQQPASSCI
jgi:hypothetical protein